MNFMLRMLQINLALINQNRSGYLPNEALMSQKVITLTQKEVILIILVEDHSILMHLFGFIFYCFVNSIVFSQKQVYIAPSDF